jgi:hypothetical protein
MIADLSRSLAKEFQESVLNHLSCPFYIASDVGCVARQRLFEFG